MFNVTIRLIPYYTKVWNELPDSVVNAPNVNIFKSRLDRHWREEDFLYNHEAPIIGHHLAEDRAKRFEHVDLTIEANACDHDIAIIVIMLLW